MPRNHVVTFYERDDELVTTVAGFIADGLRCDEVGVLITTAGHLSGIESELTRLGLDARQARLDGALVVVDADDVRGRYSASGEFDVSSLMSEVREQLHQTSRSGRAIRVVGELVALLWDAGQFRTALDLEGEWNRLSREMPFSLMCAYPHAIVDGHHGSIADVCGAHAAVVGEIGRVNEMVVARVEHAQFFAHGIDSPGAARRFVARVLREWGRADLVDDASIVVAELTTNAVSHARSEFVVAISCDGPRVLVSVRDASDVTPSPGEPTVDSISGRGLRLVGTLARRWGTERLGAGKVVWAELA